MESAQNYLLLMGCSSRKANTRGDTPAIFLYDGPLYQDLRKFLSEHGWPASLRLGILSAKHGCIGALTLIRNYDRRLDRFRAIELEPRVRATLSSWKNVAGEMVFAGGKGYLDPFRATFSQVFGSFKHLEGGIGEKRRELAQFLHSLQPRSRRPPADPAALRRRTYFLPDWEDVVDAQYDFAGETFSHPDRQERCLVHVTREVGEKACDGILISLAQRYGNKGILRRLAPDDPDTTAPVPVRKLLHAGEDLIIFGDCGAFSYRAEEEPPLTPETAVFLYELHEFDLGASVDHIPLPELPEDVRRHRIAITRENAERFLAAWRKNRARFVPVGIAHGLRQEDYAEEIQHLLDMGYRHIALGGLVFRNDREIEEIVRAAAGVRDRYARPMWLHLFGVYRPRLQALFRHLRVDSFDSASYYRKAWLRSNQNYLATNGIWYAAIRVPMSSDPRTLKKLIARGISTSEARSLEQQALKALRLYGEGRLNLHQTLQSVMAWDDLVDRREKERTNLEASYMRTLRDRPWEQCRCGVCTKLGIEVIIFRGADRNRRRGIHNTLMLYRAFASQEASMGIP